MIEDIKKNIVGEINILKEISIYARRIETADPTERNLLLTTINSLIDSIKIINASIPNLVAEISLARKLPVIKKRKEELEKIHYLRGETEFKITIRKRDKLRLLKELGISESLMKKLKKKGRKTVKEYNEFKAARGYSKLANKFFLNYSNGLIKKGYFKNLSRELQKANIDMLSHAYVALTFMTSFLALIFAIALAVFLLFFNINLEWPMATLYEGSYIIRFLKIFWIPIVAPFITFCVLYLYPVTEKKALARRINQELPFSVIHMSAVSGSGIQPSEIFRIIGLSKEYPYLRKEIRKVLNQINLYGYDLVTALSNTASNTSSEKLSELFTGLATTINSGGDFSEFFAKRAETLLLDYRLERQKYAKTAETLMDIYISVVIAAPMVLMLFLIILTIGNFSIGFSTVQLTVLIISVIAVINVIFLMFIHLNQPTY